MAKMSISMATQVLLLAIFIAILLLMSSEVATAVLHDAATGPNLGRRALLADYNTTGRGGYN
ncbi:hypothetical protein Patl1_08115 [Pistacia atlantica]|uniref:Uncharacterized protein n=1 Tax=Pistacia atlantica TaxID=434234 RepID=A0ACC1AJA4_9ROSI|nr:hypothetical protein Patl1_08115 [Pistacia atlantica]